MDWEPGRTIGNLRILEQIGRGTFGVVLLAHDELLGRRVALKILAPDLARSSDVDPAQMLDEARLIGRFEHPNVVRLYRVHEAPGVGWIIEMEFVEGGTLEDVVDTREPLLSGRAIEIGRELAAALEAAHAAGVVHGDIKPSNVLLTRDGRSKLADFGLAAAAQDTARASDQLIGTPRYMSPEVILGGVPTAASDIWSLGVLMYQLQAGVHPFSSGNMGALFHAIQHQSVVPLASPVPPRIVDAIDAALDKDPTNRPNAAELLRAFENPSGPVQQALRKASNASPEPPPIGREAEHRTLLRRLREASDGRFAGVVLVGEAGIGKSTLAHSIGAHAESQDIDWLSIRADPLRGLLPTLVDSLRRRSGDLTPLARSAARDPEDENSERFESPRHLVQQLRALIRRATRRRTLAILVDDAQVAKHEELEWLRQVTVDLSSERLCLMLAVRSSDGSGSTPTADRTGVEIDFDDAPGWRVMPVDPLGGHDIYAILEQGGHRLDARVGRRVASIAEGNPLFALELVRHLLDTAVTTQEEGEIRPGPNWEGFDLPKRVHGLVALRLTGLDPEDRELLEFAAADEETFEAETLARIMEIPVLRVLRRLQRIYRDRGLVVPSDDRFRFRHAVVREALYSQIAGALKIEIHRRVAAHLEESGSPSSSRIGLHWSRAGELDRAQPYLLRGAAAAGGRQELARMIELCALAGVTPEHVPDDIAARHVDTMIELAYCYSDSGRKTEARRIFDALDRMAAKRSDEQLTLRLMVRRGKETLESRGVDALDLDAFHRATERLPPSRELGTAHYVLGLVAKHRADYEEAVRQMESALAQYRRVGRLASVSVALDSLGSLASRRGKFDDARALYADAEKISRSIGRLANAAVSRVNSALVARKLGQFAEARAQIEDAIRLFAAEGQPKGQAHALLVLAELHADEGDGAGLRQRSDDARRILNRIDYPVAGIGLESQLAEIAIADGDAGRALHHISRGRTLNERLGARAIRVELDAAEAKARAAGSEPDAARSLASRALDDPLLREDVAVANRVAEQIAFAGLAGMPLERLGKLRRIRRGLDKSVRGTLLAARILRAPRPTRWRLRVCRDALAPAPDRPHRAVTRLVQYAIDSLYWSGLDERDRARRDREEALRIQQRLGTRLLPSLERI